ncbi:hypothetical protein [Parasulfuritortus cantonensis]|nr:hypothetical protein [Parasulfuritortus cantonensis]
MHGLDIRMRYAKARIAVNVLGADPMDELWDSVMEAETLGHHDYQAGLGRDDVPAMFKDERELREAWEGGWDEQDQMERIKECPYCNDPSFVFCPVHG